MKSIQNIIIVILLIVFTGCASQTSRPTEIRGNTLINRSTGFKGWSVTFPENYKNIDTASLGINSRAYVAWYFAQSIDTGPGAYASEHHVYESDYSAIAISTVQVGRLYDSSHVTRLLDNIIKGWIFPQGTEIDKKVVVLNGRKVAKMSRLLSDGKKYNSVYQIPIPPSHIIAINTYCDSTAKDKMDADIEALISGLTNAPDL
jgi:hypothetical protein